MNDTVNDTENDAVKLRQLLEPGDQVLVDNNLDPVTVMYQTPARLYTRVKSGSYEWELMTCRLTKV